MDKKATINTLQAAIRSIEEVNWLTNLVTQELINDELSSTFHSRMLEINSAHLREAIEIIQRAQKMIETLSIDPSVESIHPLTESSNLDRSPNP
jgi:hypothetical protein